jgi:hypothetical protein
MSFFRPSYVNGGSRPRTQHNDGMKAHYGATSNKAVRDSVELDSTAEVSRSLSLEEKGEEKRSFSLSRLFRKKEKTSLDKTEAVDSIRSIPVGKIANDSPKLASRSRTFTSILKNATESHTTSNSSQIAVIPPEEVSYEAEAQKRDDYEGYPRRRKHPVPSYFFRWAAGSGNVRSVPRMSHYHGRLMEDLEVDGLRSPILNRKKFEQWSPSTELHPHPVLEDTGKSSRGISDSVFPVSTEFITPTDTDDASDEASSSRLGPKSFVIGNLERTRSLESSDRFPDTGVSMSARFDITARKELIANTPQSERNPDVYGWAYGHRVFSPEEEDPVIACRILGHGSLGVVEEVRRKDTQLPTFVRKRVQLSPRKSQAKATLAIIQEEARNLASLVHPHIVALIGSYEEHQLQNRHFYYLLMVPVGDNDIKNFLDIVGERLDHEPASLNVDTWKRWIHSWFTCLSSALAYMHENGVRHQDIKPSNIIHKGEKVYFTDFSSSCAFDVGRTTSTENPSRSSPMYAAPEITDKYQGSLRRHGRASDIFALGCVFCDMLSVLIGRSVHYFQEYLINDTHTDRSGSVTDGSPLHYSRKVGAIGRLLWQTNIFSSHIAAMLRSDRKQRPTAANVLQELISNQIFDESCGCWQKVNIAIHLPMEVITEL